MRLPLHSGPRSVEATGPVDFLVACHDRIRHTLARAERLAEARAAAPAEIVEVARGIAFFLGVGLPLHAEDEDRSILVHLRDARFDVAQAVAITGEEHPAVEALARNVEGVCRRIEAAPDRLRELQSPLGASITRLRTLLDVHLVREEELVFPEVHRLPRDTQARMLAEMKARRQSA